MYISWWPNISWNESKHGVSKWRKPSRELKSSVVKRFSAAALQTTKSWQSFPREIPTEDKQTLKESRILEIKYESKFSTIILYTHCMCGQHVPTNCESTKRERNWTFEKLYDKIFVFFLNSFNLIMCHPAQNYWKKKR